MFRRKHLKYITFTVPIKKEVTKIDKKKEVILHMHISYIYI